MLKTMYLQLGGFLSRQVAVQCTNPQFLHETPHSAEQLAAAHDHGQHPLPAFPTWLGYLSAATST